MKKFIILLAFISFNLNAQSIPEKTNKFINDYANVLSDDEEERLRSICDMIFQESTSQVAVIVTNEVDENSSIEEFALNTAQKWGIGQNGVDNGVLILVCPNIRKSRIEVGYGLEGILTDAYTKRLQVNHFRPNFKNNDYYTGLAEALLEIKKQINPEAIALAEQEKKQQEKEAAETAEAIGNFFINFLLFLAAAGLIGFSIYYAVKKKREREERERLERERLERIERQKRQEEERLERIANDAKNNLESIYKKVSSELVDMNGFQNSESLLNKVKDIRDTTITRLGFKKREEFKSICDESTREIQQMIFEIKKNFEIKKKVEKDSKNYRTENFKNSFHKIYADTVAMIKKLKQYDVRLNNPDYSFEEIHYKIVTKAENALQLLNNNRFVEANNELLSIEKIVTEVNSEYSNALSNTDTINKSISFLNNDAVSRFNDYVKSAKSKFADSDMTDLNLKKEWNRHISNLEFHVDKSANPLVEFKRVSAIISTIKDYNDRASAVIAAEEKARRKKKEKEEEEERRRRRKKEEEEEDDRRRRNSSYSSGFGYGYSSSDSSSSSSSSSSSDFGGGSFGGGGSSDSW